MFCILSRDVLFGSSGYQLDCTVAAVSAQHPVEHVKNALQNITTEGTKQSVGPKPRCTEDEGGRLSLQCILACVSSGSSSKDTPRGEPTRTWERRGHELYMYVQPVPVLFGA